MSQPPNDPELAQIMQAMDEQGRNRAWLGRLLGLDSSQVTRTLQGRRRLQRHEAQKAREALGLQQAPANVSGGSVVPMPGLVPLFGWVGAATQSRLTIADQNLRGYVPMHPNQLNIRDAFALEVADVSMSPRYEPGETVYLAPHKRPRSGDDCVVVTTEHEGLLKRFVRWTPDHLVLHQLNPPGDLQISLERVQAIHTVVGRG